MGMTDSAPPFPSTIPIHEGTKKKYKVIIVSLMTPYHTIFHTTEYKNIHYGHMFPTCQMSSSRSALLTSVLSHSFYVEL
jgi:hypothetical protein